MIIVSQNRRHLYSSMYEHMLELQISFNYAVIPENVVSNV